MGTNPSRRSPRSPTFHSFIFTVVLVIVLVSGLAVSLRAQDLSGALGGMSNGVQYSVLVDGGLAVVRLGQGDIAAESATLFERDARTGRWALARSRTAAGVQSSGRLSYAVAVSGDRAVVGAEWHDGFRGAAYVLRNDGGAWVVEQRLSPAGLGPYDHFGGAVAMSGEYVIVGAAWHDLFRGAAYVFKDVDRVWTEVDKLTASDAGPEREFGKTVSLSGGAITIHDSRDGVLGGGQAVAYEFKLVEGSWVEQKRTWQSLPVESTAGTSARASVGKTVLTSGVLDAVGSVEADGEAAPIVTAEAPPPPDSVKATNGTLAREDRVDIMWWSSAGLDAIIYKIYRDNALLSVAARNDSLYSDRTGTLGVPYEYCVVVKDMTTGQESDTSSCAEGKRVIWAPISVNASDGEYVDHVEIRWVGMSSINTGYSIRRNVGEIGTTGASGIVFRDSLAVAETPYLYQVVATVAGGYESAAGQDSGWVGTILPPKNVQATDGQWLNWVRVTWESQGPDTLGYLVYRDSELIASPAAGVTTYDDSTAAFGDTCTYCVAVNGNGELIGVLASRLEPSEETTLESVWICDNGCRGLNAPGSVSASDATYDDRIRVTWKDLSKLEDGYEVSRVAFGDTLVVDTTRANVTLYDDFTASPDFTFTYLVRAVHNLGGVSLYSNDTGYRSAVLAPTEVEASDGTFEEHTNITWTSTSTTVALFPIYRDGAFLTSVSKGDRSYHDYGGTAGQVYEYTVAAMTALEVEALGVSDEGKRALKAPSQLIATDETYEDRVVVSWTDNSTHERGYVVIREDTLAAESDTTFKWTSGTKSLNDYTAVPGVRYKYSVAAFDTVGGVMGYSAPAIDLGRRVLLAPTNVRADGGVSETEVEITWVDNSNAEDGYRVYRKTTPLDSTLAGSTLDNHTSYVDTSPVLGETRQYSVVAFDSYGESAVGADSGYTTILAPVSFNASDFYGDRIELTWVDRSGIEVGFRVYRDDAWIATVGPDTTSFTDHYRLPGDAEIVGSVGTGNAYDVAVAGNYAYIASYLGGLHVIDISEPETPSIVGSVDTPGIAIGVAVAGHYAYVADGDSGLKVIDISEPETPSIVGSVDTPDSAYDVAVTGSYAYVADDVAGLHVIDISEPEIPSIVGSVDTPGLAWGVSVAGSYAYVADASSGLQVIDITDPENPSLAGSVDTPGAARGVAVAGNYACVADDWSGIQIIDITDPATPLIVGSVNTPGLAYDVAVTGHYAYVADYSSGLQIIDISEPETPSIVGGVETPSNAPGVAVAGNYAYIADYVAGLHVISIPSIVPGETYEYYVEAYNGTLRAQSDVDYGSIYVAEPPAAEVTALTVKLLASDGTGGEAFGWSVGISGDRAIVGAYGDDGATGSAYILERDAGGTWTETDKLLAGDGLAYDNFGYSVAISGDRAVVGAYGDDSTGIGNDVGSAYIFERGTDGTWTRRVKLIPIDAAAGDVFGHSVGISGDRVVVGAYGKGYGCAYIFERGAGGSWPQQAKLVASDGSGGDNFGYSVAISGDRVIAGAFVDDITGSGTDDGSAYIFERGADGTWGEPGVSGTRYETTKLAASDAAAGDQFGYSVGISGDLAIVAAWRDDDKGSNSGSAYVFERDAGGSWTETEKLLAGDGAENDWLGRSVSVSGNMAIVGTDRDDDKGSSSGSAYVFERDALGVWTQKEKLLAGDGVTEDYFGWSVAISGEGAIIGAWGHDEQGVSSGSAYMMVDLAASAYAVAATDGTLKSRVRVTWEDRSTNERGFQVYRDGERLGSATAPNVQVYEDFDAEPGRTYQYGVATVRNDLSEELPEVLDYGWRPANGSVTGRVSTSGGAASEDISVAIEPLPTKALLFDGTGGRVIVPDNSGTLGFTADSAFTIETWVKYSGDGGSGVGNGTMIAKASPAGGAQSSPFQLVNLRSKGEPGRVCFKMIGSTGRDSVSSVRDDLNDNTWHHVACVHDAEQNKIMLFVDGVLQGDTTDTGLGNIANTEPVTLGAGADSSSWFGGQLDEVRIWSVARDSAAIAAGMYKQLDPRDEANLVAYWPLDEGSPDEARQGGNAAVTDVTAGAHHGVFVDGVYWSESSTPLDIYPETDAEGNYVLSGVRYGTQSTFKIRPFDGESEGRQFEPAYRVVTLTTEDPVENQVNFNDISSFTVSGVVRYDGTSCPAPDVQIFVGDEEGEQPSGVTDKNGKFGVSVDFAGDVDYTIRPSQEGHTFVPESYSLTVDRDTMLVGPTGVTFTDVTQRMLSGRVGGGCGRSIGDVVITIRSENNCLVRADTVSAGDSTYSVSLPPQTYLVGAAVVEDSIPDGLNKFDVVKFFQTLGERQVELADTSATLDFVYRAPLVVAITGMESFVTCDALTFEGRELPDSLPVIPQQTLFELTIIVNEDYGAGGTCPLDSGTVTIYDEISDRENVPAVLAVVGGEAVYRTFGNTPSLIVGRVDAQGNDRSFQKLVRAVVTVEGRSPVTATEWALVTGHVAPEGADFVTFTTEEMPFYILRDPPGDNSHAFLEKGFTTTSTIDFNDSTWTTHNDGEIRDVKLGYSVGWTMRLLWLLPEAEYQFAVQKHDQYKYTEFATVDSTGATVVSTTIDEQFNTSPSDLFTGGEGDVFVGAGLNYIFSEVGVVEVDENCEVIRSESVGFEPGGFQTVFAYTERHIADVLIPELESKVEYYRGVPDSDSVAVFEEMADNWREMLTENEYLKSSARLKENRSFSAGADYTYSFTSDTTETYRRTVTLFKDSESASGTYFDLGGVWDSDKLDVSVDHTVNVEELEDTTGTHSTTVGYVLSDDDIGDRFTVDIKQDSQYPSPVFDVRAGASSCPYEPWPDASGEARMLKRDNPWLGIVPESARRDDVPPDDAAVFTLQLANQSETDESRIYALRLLTDLPTSNPYGAIVKVSGETIMNGLQQYFVAPGQMQEAALTVERGPTHYDYDSLAVILYAPCEYALWERGGPLQQADTLYFSVTFQDQGPVVFGTPEPSDGELSFGEDISVTFNEAIDCEAIRPDSLTLTYLDGPNADSTIDVDFVCDGKTIILGLNPTVDPNDLEGRRLRARVTAVQDRAGNMMAGAVTWEFVCRQSQFTWSELALSREVPYRNPGTITAELVNGTKDPVEFNITETPPWLTVSPSEGTIPPAGKQSVSLAVSQDLSPGTHDSVVVAEAANPDQGVAVLDVHLTVSCQEPEWAVNPGAFEHSMTLVAELDIGGAVSEDQDDKVAAFVGNQLRGVAHVDSVVGLTQPNIAFLTIYSNRAQGETVRFQVWDKDSCRLYNSTLQSYPFVTDSIVGSPNSPVTLTATEIPGDSTLTIAVSQGWTWISTNVRSGDMSVTGVLSDLTPSPGDIIKSHDAFSQFVDDTTGWSGGLTEIDNACGYKVKLSEGGTIVHKGAPMDTLHVPVVRYWNWVSYLPCGPLTVAVVMDSLMQQVPLLDGDMVKSQDAFAGMYNNAWYGSLDSMEPGKGYKLYLQAASETPGVHSFRYPTYVPPSPMPWVASGEGEGGTVVAVGGQGETLVAAGEALVVADGEPSWTVNHHAYQHNMTVTGVLSIGGVESIDENDIVGAFVGEECRGTARPVYVEGVRRYEVFLVVCSNEAADEEVMLRAFDADAGVIYNVKEILTFEADKVEGTVRNPTVFTAASVWQEETPVVPTVYALRQNYPNPFNPVTTIGYDVPAPGGRVTIRVYDVAGRLVRTLVDAPQAPGRKSITWDGRSNNGHSVATGVYIYRMTAPGFEKTLKMVMLK